MKKRLHPQPANLRHPSDLPSLPPSNLTQIKHRRPPSTLLRVCSENSGRCSQINIGRSSSDNAPYEIGIHRSGFHLLLDDRRHRHRSPAPIGIDAAPREILRLDHRQTRGRDGQWSADEGWSVVSRRGMVSVVSRCTAGMTKADDYSIKIPTESSTL